MFIDDKFILAPFIKDTNNQGKVLSIAGQIKNKVKNQRLANGVNIYANWSFYQGDQAQYFIQRINEPNEVYQKRKDKAVIVNFTKLIVDTNTKFLYASAKIGRQFGNAKKTQDGLRHINDLINIEQYQLESKRYAGIFGESITRLVPTDENTGEIVFGNATQTTYPHPIQLNPADTFVYVNSLDQIKAVVIDGEYTDYANDKTITTLELIVNDSRWYWEDGQLKSAELNQYALSQEFVVQVNNKIKKDDISDILNLQTQLNETISDNSFFFERHGRPQLVSSVDLSHVVPGDGKVWNIDLDSEEHKKVLDQMGFLVWDGKMAEAMKHAKELEARIMKIAYVASISTSDIESTGQLRTGAALVTCYGSTIKLTEESRVTWSINEKKLSYAIASFDAKLHGQTLDERYPEYKFRLIFPRSIGIPGEELVDAQIDVMYINSHLKTFKELTQELHPYMSEDEADAQVEQIMEDSKAVADALRVFESVKADASGTDAVAQTNNKLPAKSSKQKSMEQNQ